MVDRKDRVQIKAGITNQPAWFREMARLANRAGLEGYEFVDAAWVTDIAAPNSSIEISYRRVSVTEVVGTTPIRTVPTLQEWDRSRVRQQIEEATGYALSVDDSSPDSFIAIAQNLGMQPQELQMWIYDGAAADRNWSMEALKNWAERYGFVRVEPIPVVEDL